MNSIRTVPVTLDLIKAALECYWRSLNLVKENEDITVNIKWVEFDDTPRVPQFSADINSTKEVVDTFRL